MSPLPLWLDSFLLPYNVSQAIFVGFVLTVLAVVPLKSQKVLSLTLAVFGLLFALAPIQTSSITWRLLGIGLIIVAPLLYVTARD